MKYLLGIDGGGTGCRAAIADLNGNLLGMGQSGPANIVSDLQSSLGNILSATDLALAQANLPPKSYAQLHACLGLAGANVSGMAEQLQEILPFAASNVVSDGIIALQGAIGDQDGITVILGTGSVTISRFQGQIKMIGGWGFKVSDLAGGARLGQKILEEALLAYDGIAPTTALSAHILQHFDNQPHNIVRFAHDARPSDFGQFAPQVFTYAAQNDALAKKILQQAVTTIEAALDAVLHPQQQVVSLIGGLGALYAPLLDARFQPKLRAPIKEALGGALDLAAKNLSKTAP